MFCPRQKKISRTFKIRGIVSDGTADIVDVVYVNIVTLSMGCEKWCEHIANEGQEWMGIHTTSKIAGSPSN
jgi:hypothetical protein